MTPDAKGQAAKDQAAALRRRALTLLRDNSDPRICALAVPLMRQALDLAPDHLGNRLVMVNILYMLGRIEAAREACAAIVASRPQALAPRLMECMLKLPPLYRDEADLAATRAEYLDGLRRFVAATDCAAPGAAEDILAFVPSTRPNLLAYQGECDLEAQSLFGGLVCRAMATYLPEFASLEPVPPPAPGEPVRVGIVSGFFHEHSTWQVILQEWLEGLDPARVALHGYYTAAKWDSRTHRAASRCVHFHGEARSLEDWARRIRADRLHVLIHTDFGGDPTATRLAAMRLAPVQCITAAYCSTSGLPTMDYFLSSEAMEPADGDAHYSERLVRLPDIGFCYPPPRMAPADRDRASFGFGTADVLYIIPQYPFKLLPRQDALLARIAARVPGSRFLLFLDPRSEANNRLLMSRVAAAFAAEGLDAGQRVSYLGHFPYADYLALLGHADVCLDTLGWNGGTTTSEALARGLPVVTLPGPVMRNRLSYAMLKHLGVTETVAADLDDYVDIAVGLGLDPGRRAALRERIHAALPRLYDHAPRLAGLTDFLERVART